MENRKIGILISYLNTGLNMVCGLFLSSFLLRCLGAAEYGVYQSIASFANYLVLLQFGTGTAMTRNISMCLGRGASKDEIDRNVSTIWTVGCLLAVAILTVSMIFYTQIPKIYEATMTLSQIAQAKKIFALTAAYLVLSFLNQTVSGVALAYEHYYFSSVMGIVRNLLRTIALVVWLSIDATAQIIAWVDLALYGIMFAVTILYCKHHFCVSLRFGKVDKGVLAGVAPFCIAMFLQTVVNQTNNNVDKFLIGVMLSPESVSLYSVGMYIYSVFSSLTTIPISLYAPQVSKMISGGQTAAQTALALVAPCRLTVMIGGGVLFGFLAVGRPFISMIYGEEYLQAWTIALILMIPAFLNMVNGVLVNVLDALNKRMIRSVVLVGVTLCNIVLTVIALRQFGIVGAAAATAVSTLIGQVLIMNVYYGKRLKIPVLYLFREAFRGILIWLMIACAAAGLISNSIPNIFMSFVISGVVFVLVFFTGFFAFGAGKGEKENLKRLLHRR